MFTKACQGRLNRKGKPIDDETRNAIVSLFQCSQNDSIAIFNC